MTFRNRISAFLWGFAALFSSFVAVMTYVLLRDGPPAGHSLELALGVCAAFWMAALGLLAYAAGKPCFFATVEPGETVSVVWRYPFRTVRREARCADVEPAAVVESRDDENDPYFLARVTLPDGVSFDIAEGHDRGRCEDACASFNEALRIRT